MIKLGVNSVLFKTVSFPEAARAIKRCGYDGVEISAILGMCDHLNLETWRAEKEEIKSVMEETGLEFLSCEAATHDKERLERLFEAGCELGIPVFNIGPCGASNVDADVQKNIDEISALAELAEKYGRTLCCKAHVGSAVYNTETTLRLIEGVKSPAFGVDMDPSHIYRAGENPVEAIGKVIHAMKHIHIRDCTGRGPGPGTPELQACGTGEIDLFGYFREMAKGGYDGPVCLEVIGPDKTPEEATAIAAMSYGYMNAILKLIGKR